MRPQVYWIDLPMAGRLAIMARPRAGDWLDDEISGWRFQGIDTVTTLLEEEEVSELGLQREAGLCRELGMEFLSFPIPDRGVPESLRDAVGLAQALSTRIGEEGQSRCTVEPESDALLSSQHARSFAWDSIPRQHLR
jgi:hypothetical protein